MDNFKILFEFSKEWNHDDDFRVEVFLSSSSSVSVGSILRLFGFGWKQKKMRVIMGFLKKCGSFLDSPSFDRNFLSDRENCLKSQLTNFSQALAEHEGSNGNLIGNVDLRAV